MKISVEFNRESGYIVNGVELNGSEADKYIDRPVSENEANRLKEIKNVTFFGSIVKAAATSQRVEFVNVPKEIGQQVMDLLAEYRSDEPTTTRKGRRSLADVERDVLDGIAAGTIQLMDNQRDKKNGGKVWKRKDGDGWTCLTKTELQYIPKDAQ